jgi:hypothetical protein
MSRSPFEVSECMGCLILIVVFAIAGFILCSGIVRGADIVRSIHSLI